MKMNYITIMVRNMQKTIAFYENLVGLQVIRQFNPGPGEIAFLSNKEGETMLEFIEFEDVEKVQTKGMVMSYLSEEPLEKLHSKAVSLGYNPTEIIDQKPKPKYFRVLDPDGITIEFSND